MFVSDYFYFLFLNEATKSGSSSHFDKADLPPPPGNCVGDIGEPSTFPKSCHTRFSHNVPCSYPTVMLEIL